MLPINPTTEQLGRTIFIGIKFAVPDIVRESGVRPVLALGCSISSTAYTYKPVQMAQPSLVVTFGRTLEARSFYNRDGSFTGLAASQNSLQHLRRCRTVILYRSCYQMSVGWSLTATVMITIFRISVVLHQDSHSHI